MDNTDKIDDIKSAVDIYEELDKYVVHQEDAKKAVATNVFVHMMRTAKAIHQGTEYGNKSNLLIMGPSGCGKTYMMDILADVLKLPVFKLNAKEITQMGFSGMSMEDYLNEFFKQLGGTKGSLKVLEHSIIFIDEIDKLCAPMATNKSEDHNASIQHSLLKVIEGTQYYIKSAFGRTMTLNTGNILFILGGNFKDVRQSRKDSVTKKSIGFQPDAPKDKDSLHTELMKVGMIQEFVGRISRITEVYPLNKKQLKKALVEADGAPVKQYKELYKFLGYEFKMTDKAMNKIVNDCYSNGTGVRGLGTAIDAYLEDELFTLEQEIDWDIDYTDGDDDGGNV